MFSRSSEFCTFPGSVLGHFLKMIKSWVEKYAVKYGLCWFILIQLIGNLKPNRVFNHFTIGTIMFWGMFGTLYLFKVNPRTVSNYFNLNISEDSLLAGFGMRQRNSKNNSLLRRVFCNCVCFEPVTVSTSNSYMYLHGPAGCR